MSAILVLIIGLGSLLFGTCFGVEIGIEHALASLYLRNSGKGTDVLPKGSLLDRFVYRFCWIPAERYMSKALTACRPEVRAALGIQDSAATHSPAPVTETHTEGKGSRH